MSKIEKPLLIVPTYQRRVELLEKSQEAFASIMTLDTAIGHISRYALQSSTVSPVVQKYIIRECLKKLKLSYFSYLAESPNSLALTADFFTKLKANDVSIREFGFSEKKESELSQLLDAYNAFLNTHSLADRGDCEKEVYQYLLKDDGLRQVQMEFTDIRLDSFVDTDSFSMFTSEYQKKIYQRLAGVGKSIAAEPPSGTCTLLRPDIRVFDSCDEMRTAVKLAKELMINGAADRDILVVTPKIEEHIHHFYRMLNEYDMKGSSSIGLKLSAYASNIGEINKAFKNDRENEIYNKILNTWQAFKAECAATERLLKHHGLSFDKGALEQELLESRHITSFKNEGIVLTEPNQLIASTKRYHHIIFAGADISSFPVSQKDTFLYTAAQAKELFHVNDSLDTSIFHYERLKECADTLYLVNAEYYNGRKTYPSLLLEEAEPLKIDFSKLDNKHDLLLSGAMDPSLKINTAYCEAMNSRECTPFHTQIDPVQDEVTLSASQLNTFAGCPLRYYFSYILHLKAPRDEEDGYDAMQRGSLLHYCFHTYVLEIQSGAVTLENPPSPAMKKAMIDVARKEHAKLLEEEKFDHENVFHLLVLNQITKGLDDPSVEECGELLNFLAYLSENFAGTDELTQSLCEERFYLNRDFNPTDKENRFITGFIDRLDAGSDPVTVIDYKSSIPGRIGQEMKALKNFQLPLYLTFARRRNPGAMRYEAHLVSFRGKTSRAWETGGTVQSGDFEKIKNTTLHYTDEFEQEMFGAIDRIYENIKKGAFPFDASNEDLCEKYCDYRFICNRRIMKEAAQ